MTTDCFHQLELRVFIQFMKPRHIRSSVRDDEICRFALEPLDDRIVGLLGCDVSLQNLHTRDRCEMLQIDGDDPRICGGHKHSKNGTLSRHSEHSKQED